MVAQISSYAQVREMISQQLYCTGRRSGVVPYVVSGAMGCGKTHLIAELVTEGIIQHNAKPIIIVPNRNSAEYMQKMLSQTFAQQSVSADTAENSPGAYAFDHKLIVTPHAFALSILEKAESLRLCTIPKVLSACELDQRLAELLSGHIATGGSYWPDDLIPVLSQPSFISQLRDFMLRAQENSIKPQQLRGKARTFSTPLWNALAATFEEYDNIVDMQAEGDVAQRKIHTKTHPDTLSYWAPSTYSEIIEIVDDLLKKIPALRSALQESITHIFIDDIQSFTPNCGVFLQDLSQTIPRQIFTIDRTLSLYSWRGAEVNILDQLPHAVEHSLPQSFRLPDTIAALANFITTDQPIQGNTTVGQLHVQRCTTELARNNTIINSLLSEHEKLPWDQIAIIARSNSAFTGQLLTQLNQAKIPYNNELNPTTLADISTVNALQHIVNIYSRQPITHDSLYTILTSPLCGASGAAAHQLATDLATIIIEATTHQRSAATSTPTSEATTHQRSATTEAPSELATAQTPATSTPAAATQTPATDPQQGLMSQSAQVLAKALTSVQRAQLGSYAETNIIGILIPELICTTHTATRMITMIHRLWDNTTKHNKVFTSSENYPEIATEIHLEQRAVTKYIQHMEQFYAQSSGKLATIVELWNEKFSTQISALPICTLPNAITLTSAHASSGREWEHVIIIGLEEGTWPNPAIRTDLLETQKFLYTCTINNENSISTLNMFDINRHEERNLLLTALSRSAHSVDIYAIDDPLGKTHTYPSEFFTHITEFCAQHTVSNTLEQVFNTPEYTVDRAQQPSNTPEQLDDPAQQLNSITQQPDDPPQLSISAAENTSDALSYSGPSRATLNNYVLSLRHTLDSSNDDEVNYATHLLAYLAKNNITAAHPKNWYHFLASSTTLSIIDTSNTIRLSPSKLDTLLECPLDWFFSTLMFSTAQRFIDGTISHLANEYLAQNISAEQLIPIMYEQLHTHLPGKEFERTIRTERIINTINNLAADLQQRWKTHTPVGAEVNKEAEIGAITLPNGTQTHVKIVGKIDRIDQDHTSQEYIAVDMKTKNQAITKYEAKNDLQLFAYRRLLDRHYTNSASLHYPNHISGSATYRDQTGTIADAHSQEHLAAQCDNFLLEIARLSIGPDYFIRTDAQHHEKYPRLCQYFLHECFYH